MVFGGKVVQFGGDFRQILPVITNGSRHEVVHASLNSSYLWQHCKTNSNWTPNTILSLNHKSTIVFIMLLIVMHLTINMRLEKGANAAEKKEIHDFADWILDIGNGKNDPKNIGESMIEFPDDMLIPNSEDHIGKIIEETYPDLNEKKYKTSFFQEKSILVPTHELVFMINDRMLQLLPGEETTYDSSDSVGVIDMDGDFNESFYNDDFLNSIRIPGLPHHTLKLKIGAPIMCMRNIDQTGGLCNGTRMQVMRLGVNIIEAKVISGGFVRDLCAIPRMVLSPTDNKIPFKFNRRQFPILLCFTMIINKSQGQTLTQVGLFLQRPVFSHRQLYVAVSRVKNKKGLKILCCDDEGNYTN